MRVNSTVKGFFNNRLVMGSVPMAIGTIVMVAILLIASSFTRRTDRDLRAKETNIIIRDIGHQLLLQAGDKTSRVLPVKEIKEGFFQLTFEHRLFFDHDSLMALTQRMLTKEQFPSGYTVTVQDCKDAAIMYGFQINNTKPDIMACKGRSEPQSCYIFEFAFPDFYETPINYTFIGLASGMLMLSFVALLIGRFRKTPVPMPALDQGRSIINESAVKLTTFGKFVFDVKNQRLLLDSEVISLTDKECKILELLNANFNELTPRETLMQIWINEGVITGRSLDMFVSKLRKKLSGDPELSITNVHGKGYKLEVRS